MLGRCNFLLLLLCMSPFSGVLSDWVVDSHSSDQDVVEGSPFLLMCRIDAEGLTGNRNWKTCRWRRDEDSVNCIYDYKCIDNCGIFGTAQFEIEATCDKALGDVEFFGSDPEEENHICGINVPDAGTEDDSTWTCFVEECKGVVGGCEANVGTGNYATATMKVTVHPREG